MTIYEEALDKVARYISDSKRGITRYTDDEICDALSLIQEGLETREVIKSEMFRYKELAIPEIYGSKKAFPDSIFNKEMEYKEGLDIYKIANDMEDKFVYVVYEHFVKWLPKEILEACLNDYIKDSGLVWLYCKKEN